MSHSKIQFQRVPSIFKRKKKRNHVLYFSKMLNLKARLVKFHITDIFLTKIAYFLILLSFALLMFDRDLTDNLIRS